MSKKKQADPEKERHANIVKFHTTLKGEVRSLINTYGREAEQLGVRFPDPHAAIIAALQVALAEAGAAYLNLCGAKTNEAFERVVQTTGVAMQNWVHTILKQNNVRATVEVDKVKLNETPPNTIN